MKFLTGDDTGLIKVVHVEKQKAQLSILQFEDVWESSTLVSTLVFWKFHVNPMWVIVPSYTKLCFSICVVQAQRTFLYVRQETLAVLRLQQHGIAKIETEHTANDHLKLRSKERYSRELFVSVVLLISILKDRRIPLWLTAHLSISGYVAKKTKEKRHFMDMK